MPPRNDKFSVDALYQDAVENIRFAKLQQWRVTNYALLIYAVAFFLRREPPLNGCEGKAVVTAIIAIPWAFSIFVLCRLQDSIKKFRDRVDWVYQRSFTPAERLKLQMEPKSFWFDPGIFFGLLAVSSFGALLVVVLVWHWSL